MGKIDLDSSIKGQKDLRSCREWRHLEVSFHQTQGRRSRKGGTSARLSNTPTSSSEERKPARPPLFHQNTVNTETQTWLHTGRLLIHQRSKRRGILQLNDGSGDFINGRRGGGLNLPASPRARLRPAGKVPPSLIRVCLLISSQMLVFAAVSHRKLIIL